jgi:hypothetical protein
MFIDLYGQDDEQFDMLAPGLESEWEMPPVLLEELPLGLIEDQA